MAFRPVNPYDTLVQQLLQNVQRTTEATERGFQAQREERLIDEERAAQDARLQQQRAWQQADYSQQREDELSDRAESHRIGLLTRFQDLSGYITPDNEMYGLWQAALEALSAPSGLTGREAWEQAASGTYAVTVGDEQQMANVYDLLSRGSLARDAIMRNEGWQDNLINLAITSVTNTALPDDTRMGWANVVVGSGFFDNDTKHMFLEAAGVSDKEARDRIILSDRVREGDLALLQLNIATAATSLGQMIEKFEWAKDWNTIEYEEAQRQYERNEAEFQQTTFMNDLEAFTSFGVMPSTPERQARLAARMGLASTEALEARGRSIFRNWQERERLTNESIRLSNELTGLNLEIGQVQKKQAELTYNRDLLWGELDKKLSTAEYAAAAMLNGDVNTLQMLQSLQGLEPYSEALRDFEFDDMIARAEAIQGYADDKRAYDARELQVLGGALERGQVTSIQEFVSTVASHFLEENFEAGEDLSHPSLRAAVRRWVNSVSGAAIMAAGYTDASGNPDIDGFVDAVVNEAVTQRALSDRSEAATRLTTLLTVPLPEDPRAAESYMAAVRDTAEQAGFSPEEAASIASGTADEEVRRRNKSYAELREINQRADKTFIETLTGMYALVGGEGKTTAEAFADMVTMAKAPFETARDIANSQACAITVDHADFVAGGTNYNMADPVCADAAEQMDRWSAVMDWLASGTFGSDGSVSLGFPPSAVPGAGTAAPTAEQQRQRLPNQRELNARLNSAYGDEASEFNHHMYAFLPPELQQVVLQGIEEQVSLDEVNRGMVEALALLDSGSGLVAPPRGLPRLADINEDIGVGTSDWRERPLDERRAILEGTSDWMELAAQIANGEVSPTEENRAKWAERFGFQRPVTGLEAANPFTAEFWRGEPSARLAVDSEGFNEAMGATLDTLRQQATARMQRAGVAAGATPFNANPGSIEPLQGPAEEGRFSPAGLPPMQPQQSLSPEAQQEQQDRESQVMQLGRILGIDPATAYGSGIDASQLPLGVQNVTPSSPSPSPRVVPPAEPDANWSPFVPQANNIMDALIRQESGGNHTRAGGGLTTSVKGALGITQIMPPTAAKPGYLSEPLVPGYEHVNFEALRSSDPAAYQQLIDEISQKMQSIPAERFVQYGRDYLAALLAEFNGDVPKALAAYNAGPWNVRTAVRAAEAAGDDANWLNYLPTAPENQRETVNYVNSIMAMLGR